MGIRLYEKEQFVYYGCPHIYSNCNRAHDTNDTFGCLFSFMYPSGWILVSNHMHKRMGYAAWSAVNVAIEA